MLNNLFCKVLTLYLIIALFALALPAPGWAMLVPAGPSEARSTDLATAQAALESSVVRQRLVDFGLTPEETAKRLGSLSDEQIHQFAADLNAVQAGGSILGDVIIILLVVLIVIAILQLSGHQVLIRR